MVSEGIGVGSDKKLGKSMAELKDSQIKNIEDGKQKKESLGRGNGSLAFRRQKKTITAYYCYWRGKQSVFVKLDDYKQSAKKPGKTLAQLRDQARDMVALKKQVAPIDLKEYLQNEAEEKLRQQEEKKRKVKEDNNRGTLEDLLTAYAGSLEDRKASSAYAVLTMFETNIFIPYPELSRKPACEVTSEDFMPVLSALYKRNSPGQYDSVRGYLSAAFNFGVRADFDPREHIKTGKTYRVKYNPISAFPKHASKPRKRVLSHEELSQLWADIETGFFDSSPQYGLFVQFCIACFGNRPIQLSRVKWSDIDQEKRTLTFLDVKGRGRKRLTTIPLTDRAIGILNKLRMLPDNYRFKGRQPIPEKEQTVFTNHSGEPLDYASVYQKIKRYTRFCEFVDKRDAQAQGNVYESTENWTMKDFRRTAVGIMTDARIIRESRYLLQSRTDGSVESRHYDVSERMEEKWEAAKKYDAMLDTILNTPTKPRDCNPETIIKDDVTPDYPIFKQRIIDDGEVMTQKYYVRAGFREATIRRWFEKLVLEGIIRKSFERYVYIDPSEAVDSKDQTIGSLNEEGYKLFKQKVLQSGELKQQKQYVQEGYSDRKVRRWFRLMVAEGLIEKVHRFYYLKQPEPVV